MSASFISFGEVLWDNLPDGSVPGGAPMNVAVRLASLGHSAGIISAVGTDEKGDRLKRFLRSRNVDTAYIQEHASLPTGDVNVSVTADGIPSYDIVSPSAWDRIVVMKDAVEAFRTADAVIFGSLACRSRTSKETLFRLLEMKQYAVFDVNLRAPNISLPLVEELMQLSDLIKLNEEEFHLICAATGSDDIRKNIQTLSQQSGAEIICVTRGNKGAIIYAEEEFFEHSGFTVPVADTVGSGDSFLAGFLSSIFTGASPVQSLEFACALGAMTAARAGANPEFSIAEIQHFIGHHTQQKSGPQDNVR